MNKNFGKNRGIIPSISYLQNIFIPSPTNFILVVKKDPFSLTMPIFKENGQSLNPYEEWIYKTKYKSGSVWRGKKLELNMRACHEKRKDPCNLRAKGKKGHERMWGEREYSAIVARVTDRLSVILYKKY